LPKEGIVMGSEPVPVPVTTEIISLTSSQGQEESTDPKECGQVLQLK